MNDVDSLLLEAQEMDINIRPEFIFGIRKDLNPNIYVIDTDFLVYAAANYIILYNYSNKANIRPQQFIAGETFSNGIFIYIN